MNELEFLFYCKEVFSEIIVFTPECFWHVLFQQRDNIRILKAGNKFSHELIFKITDDEVSCMFFDLS